MGETTNNKNCLIVIWKIFNNFWQRTSISGISNAGSTKSAFRRACWMIIFTLFLIITLRGFQGVLHDYFTYPVITSVTMARQDQVIKSIVLPLVLKTFIMYLLGNIICELKNVFIS